MKKPTAHEHAEPQIVPPDDRRSHGKALREAVPREAHGQLETRQGPARHRRPPERVERGPDAATGAAPLRPHDAVAFHLLSRLGGDHGGRPGVTPTPAFACRRAATPICELRRFRHAGAPRHLRHQRPRRDAARALGVGRQAPGRQLSSPPPIRLAATRAARGGALPACSYREHMADSPHAALRGLVPHADVDRPLKPIDRGLRCEPRAQLAEKRLPRQSTCPRGVFPKLAELHGDPIRRRQGRSSAHLPSRRARAEETTPLTRKRFAHYRATLGRTTVDLLRSLSVGDVAMKVVGIGSVGTFCAVVC